jgi:putative protease
MFWNNIKCRSQGRHPKRSFWKKILKPFRHPPEEIAMKLFKKIGKALFGSSKSKKAKKSKRKVSKKKTAESARKKTVRSAKKKILKKVPAKAKGKSAKKKAPAKKPSRMVKAALAVMPNAEVTHYFPHVNAAVLKIKTGEIRIGDELLFKGHTTNFKQKVVSMQIDHQPVMVARKGDDFGVEVKSRVRAGDLVFKK